MRDSILNVRSSGLGSAVRDIKRTGKYISKRRKEAEKRKQKQEKETRSHLNKKQKLLQGIYNKQTHKKSTKNPRTTSFKIKRPYTQKVKGTIHPVMKNYKVPKYNKWGDRIG